MPPSSRLDRHTSLKRLRLRHLILDWDGTMTQADTTSLIGIAAIKACRDARQQSARSRSQGTSDQHCQAETRAPEEGMMRACVDAYMRDYESWKSQTSQVDASAPSKNGASERASTQATPAYTIEKTQNMHETGQKLRKAAGMVDAALRKLDETRQVERSSYLRVRQAALTGHVPDSPTLMDVVVVVDDDDTDHEPPLSTLPPPPPMRVSGTENGGSSEEYPCPPTDYLSRMRDAGISAARDGQVKIRDLHGLKRLLLSWAVNVHTGAGDPEVISGDVGSASSSSSSSTSSSQSTRARGHGNRTTWAIVSVSWSRAFITGVVAAYGLPSPKPSPNLGQSSSSFTQTLRARRAETVGAETGIWCNELLDPCLPSGGGQETSGDEQGGDELRLIQTAGDKLRAMSEAVAALSATSADSGDPLSSASLSSSSSVAPVDAAAEEGAPVDAGMEAMISTKAETIPNNQLRSAVYIGDSTTDLRCLLAAGLGICMRDESVGNRGGGAGGGEGSYDPGRDKLALKLEELGIRCLSLDVLLPGRGEDDGGDDHRGIGGRREVEEEEVKEEEEKEEQGKDAERPTLYWTTSFGRVWDVLSALDR